MFMDGNGCSSVVKLADTHFHILRVGQGDGSMYQVLST